MTPSQVSFYLKRFQPWNLKVIHDIHHISHIICMCEAHIFSHPWLFSTINHPSLRYTSRFTPPACWFIFGRSLRRFATFQETLTAGARPGSHEGVKGRWHGLKWPKRTFRYDFLYQLSTQKDVVYEFMTNNLKNLWVYMDFCMARIFFRNSQVKY